MDFRVLYLIGFLISACAALPQELMILPQSLLQVLNHF